VNAIIEVKSSAGGGITPQVRRRIRDESVNPEGKPVIGYSPNLGPRAAAGINAIGGIAATGRDYETLLVVLRP
jgi:hypothetical protein